MRNCEPRSCKFIDGLVKPLKKKEKRKISSPHFCRASLDLSPRVVSFSRWVFTRGAEGSSLRSGRPRRGAVCGPELAYLTQELALKTTSKQSWSCSSGLSHQQLLIGLNMLTLHRVQQQTLLLLLFVVHLSRPVCVDVASDTEAVLGSSMKLTCISCLKREELKPNTNVNWYFTSSENNTYDRIHIFESNNGDPQSLDGPFKNRLIWNGSKDLQDVSLLILNVSESDRGIYECHVNRTFEFGTYTPSTVTEKKITLTVKEKAFFCCL
ncbi:PREDICTED: sodium channel subunit beta-3-like isoform X3 [Poecilia mexicana]|uniref:sodium channel subunit beta-3-like isoform X3 n=1 Tax=Poecilia mexicana TaxID=48701 RepID=UPI00072EEAEC|nr:PREDICTED: sodium channel subunit beta-3-like isoform X3 [Poecilia mexicana]XP_014845638.1 PREDICTED: sodium channel subunit beta-3-like isoform X3 [Poecilia mexicana]